MRNRTALAALLLVLAGPSWATTAALDQAHSVSYGNMGAYDGSVKKTGCTDSTCEIERAADGAQKTGGLTVADEGSSRATLTAEVPAPSLNEDQEGARAKPGFFKKLFTGKSLMYGLGGGLLGAGIGWVLGGPLGAIIGGLVGLVGGIVLSKMLAK